jgi:hypothetical protein
VRRKDVAALRRLGGLSGDDIDAVDRHYRQQILAQAVAQGDLILAAGLSDHVCTTFVPVHLQAPSIAAVEDRQVRKPAVRECLAGEQEYRSKQHSNRFHLISLK